MASNRSLTISVVIPLFNKADYLKQAIESVLGQSRRPQEILVIDDGSTDGGDRIVRDYASTVQLVCVPHAGVSAARNRGIEMARGQLVAFLDADDVWKPRFVENVAGLLERFPEACAAGSAYEYLIRPRKIAQLRFAGVPKGSWQGIIDYFACVAGRGAPPLTSSVVIARRAVLQQIGGFPVGVRWGEDHDTWARLALAGEIAFTTEVLATQNIMASNRATDASTPRPPLPAAATIATALETAIDKRRRAHLQKYLRRLTFVTVMTNLRYGHSALARSQLIGERRHTGLGFRWLALLLCTVLPQPFLKVGGHLRAIVLIRERGFLRAQAR